MTTPQPVWGADCPISMPLPMEEPSQVEMYGFSFTQYRLGPSITGREYEILAVPTWAPQVPNQPEVRGDARIDAGRP